MGDVIVIGGGLGGLVSAALLKRSGLKPVVLEKSDAAGGRGRTSTLGGGLFNLGPHALYLGGPAERVLLELGLPLTGKPPRPSGEYWLKKTLSPLPSGPLTLLSSSLSTREKAKLISFLATLSRMKPSGTVKQWLDAALPGEGARGLVEMLIRVTSYAGPIEQLDAGAVARQLARGLKPGVRYLDRGWQSVVDALAAQLEVRCSQKVQAVRPEQGGGFTVEVAGQAPLRARHVVLAVEPPAAEKLLPGFHLEAVPSRIACFDVALRALPRPKATLCLGVDQPLYASVHSASAQLGDAVVVHGAKYLSPEDDGRGAQAELEALFDAWQPGWRGQVKQQRFVPHLTAQYALPLAKTNGLHGRAPESHAGVHLVGDWVKSDWQLLDGVIATAEGAAGRVAKEAAAAYELAA